MVNGVFDRHLHALAQRAQDTREKGDYEAVTPDRGEAEVIVDGAGDFIAAIEEMLETSTRPHGSSGQ